MNENMTQDERLDLLVEAFKKDSVRYSNLKTPDDLTGKREVLRSLMNIRMPRPIDAHILSVQDAYLKERIRDNGIVRPEDIPTIAENGSMHQYADRISIWQGDITRLAVDAIVNAANSQMLGCFVPMHTCIDNCIHTFAGIQLRAECNRQMNELRMRYGNDYEQPTAVPMLTGGYNLPAKHVIHIVGPIVEGRLTKEHEQLLSQCYRKCLEMAEENQLESIAFCCISTGVFRFPNDRAAKIAVQTVTEWLTTHPGGIERVIFNVFKDEDKEYYEKELF